jgi:hypothetical protein
VTGDLDRDGELELAIASMISDDNGEHTTVVDVLTPAFVLGP